MKTSESFLTSGDLFWRK